MISGWTSHAGPRRSNDHGSRHKPDDEDPTRRRSSSDVTPRQTAPDLHFLSTSTGTSAQDQSQNQNVVPNSASPIDSSASSRRLGFFTDKLSSSSANRSLHPPQGHSRQDSSSAQSLLSPLGASTMSSSSTLTNSKGHISPSKVRHTSIHIHFSHLHTHRHPTGAPTTLSSSLVKCIV